MYHFFVEPGQIAGNVLTIEGADAHHIRDVLRMKKGEAIEAVDGTGRIYTCHVADFTDEAVLADIEAVSEAASELPCPITLYMGLPKFDKMELIIQKAVELGAACIVPVACRRSVVKLDKKKEAGKIARWEAIAEAAAKQSKRALIPEIRPVMTFQEAVAEAKEAGMILMPYECAGNMARTREVLAGIRPGQRVGIFIGPEGGFDPAEAELAGEAGAHVITLGGRILRTETAAITTLSILMYMLEGLQ